MEDMQDAFVPKSRFQNAVNQMNSLRPGGQGQGLEADVAIYPVKGVDSTEPLIQRSKIDSLVSVRPEEHKVNRSYKLIARLIDISVSLVVLLLTWPIIVYVARYIKKASSGPAVFKQIRIKRNRRRVSTLRYYLHPESKTLLRDRREPRGAFVQVAEERREVKPEELYYFCSVDKKMKADRRKVDLLGQPFVFYKFRTMYADARERFPELYAYEYAQEEIERLKFKIEDDPRVPKWADWLRKSSLDEVPNFINVLRGDMTLVGPRPDIPEMMKYYSGEDRVKLSVKPGITGLAQIRGRGHLSFQETLKCDVEYAQKRSLLLDLKILAMTVRETFHRNGAY